jgi:lysozyme
MPQRLDVVDVSHYNTVKSWDQVKAAGVVGVIFKATEGTNYEDPTCKPQFAAALKAGLACCTYHFLHHGSVSQQMSFYWNTIQPQVGERMMIDYEEASCTLDDLHAAVTWLMSKSQDTNKDIQVTVYSGNLLKEQLGDSYDSLLALNTDLWLAQYTSGTPSWPKGTYPIYTLWQYSESGSVPGVKGNVDTNTFNGSPENCVKWIGAAEQPVPPSLLGKPKTKQKAKPITKTKQKRKPKTKRPRKRARR